MVTVQKAISISYSGRVFVPLIIQQAMRMYRITVSSVVQTALQRSSILSQKQQDFREKKFIHLVVCLTTGPKPLPKRALHIVRSRASSFK